MIMDKLLLMSNAQAITSTAPSTDVIDLGAAMDYGIGEPALKLLCRVITTFVSGGGATLTVSLQGSDDNVTFYDMAASIAYAVAALTAGAGLLPISVPRPPAGKALPRYIRMNYTVGVSTFSAGAVTAALVLDRQDNNPPNYPAGLTVSN